MVSKFVSKVCFECLIMPVRAGLRTKKGSHVQRCPRPPCSFFRKKFDTLHAAEGSLGLLEALFALEKNTLLPGVAFFRCAKKSSQRSVAAFGRGFATRSDVQNVHVRRVRFSGKKKKRIFSVGTVALGYKKEFFLWEQ